MPRHTAHALKVGLLLSVAEGSAGGRWTNLKAMAQHAEAAGFDSLWIADHFMIPGGSDEPPHGRWECWSILSSLAAVTTRIELGTLVTCTSFRNPALLAKMLDTVEEISDGRLILGLGAGYYEPEYRAFGFPFDHRLDRFEEALQIVHGLLRNGAIDFQGRYYEARDCELRPRGPTGPARCGLRRNTPIIGISPAIRWMTLLRCGGRWTRPAPRRAVTRRHSRERPMRWSICRDRRTARSRPRCAPIVPPARPRPAPRNSWRKVYGLSHAKG